MRRASTRRWKLRISRKRWNRAPTWFARLVHGWCQVGAWHQVALTDHSWRPRRAIDEPRPPAHPQKAHAIARIIKHRLCLVVGERVKLRDGRLADRCEVHHRAHLTDDGKVDRQSAPRFRHPTTSARSRRAAARASGRILRACGFTRATCRSRARRCRSRRGISSPRAICLRRA